jgi:hypothetical protein
MSVVIDAETKSPLDHVEDIKSPAEAEGLPDHLAPGSAYRIKVERRLKAKLDAKMFLLVIIYSESPHLSTQETAPRMKLILFQFSTTLTGVTLPRRGEGSSRSRSSSGALD